MDNLTKNLEKILNDGFAIVEDIYTPDEIESIIATINKVDQSKDTFRKTDDLFAIRRFLIEVPEAKPLIFSSKLKSLIDGLFGLGYFVVKSIYFDKPEKSNWFVAWHQDLTIAVSNKANLLGYGPWTVKLGQFAVQPPLNILQDNFTIRIHLDDTDEGNGALKIVPGSHLKNIQRTENINWQNESDFTCKVKAGGVMVMRPLLFHASSRTTTNKKRRVIHIEFSKANLATGISWAEKEN
jgi:ectoine hydroxylase-related dioxygenase (phytanoyl-CoA dioxygenase family)